MTEPSNEYPIEFEKKTAFYLERIQEIDSMLPDPAQTLIRAAEEVQKPKKYLRFPAKKVVYFPPWISDDVMSNKGEHLLTWALCSETLQRVWRRRWRRRLSQRVNGHQVRTAQRHLQGGSSCYGYQPVSLLAY